MSHDFSVITPGSKDDLAGLVAIYQEAIDPSEQKTAAEIEAMLADPRYALIVSRTDGAISGFLIALFPQGADFWLLEYMAVVASGRGKRIGETLFNEAHRYGRQRDGARVMLIEVDQPGHSTNPSNDTQARYRFYQRMACLKLQGVDYILPLETGGMPPPMMLLTFGAPGPAKVSKAQVRNWLTTIYVDAYGQAASDPRIGKMMSPLEDQVALLPL